MNCFGWIPYGSRSVETPDMSFFFLLLPMTGSLFIIIFLWVLGLFISKFKTVSLLTLTNFLWGKPLNFKPLGFLFSLLSKLIIEPLWDIKGHSLVETLVSSKKADFLLLDYLDSIILVKRLAGFLAELISLSSNLKFFSLPNIGFCFSFDSEIYLKDVGDLHPRRFIIWSFGFYLWNCIFLNPFVSWSIYRIYIHKIISVFW